MYYDLDLSLINLTLLYFNPCWGTSTNVRPTKVGQYKRWTNNRRTGTNVELRHTSDQCKRWTSAKVEPVQTLNQCKRWTSANFGPVQRLDQCKRWTSAKVGPVQRLDQSKRRTGTFIRKNVGLVHL